MMWPATEYCSDGCPRYAPCGIFTRDREVPEFCEGCGHREICHTDTDKADEEGTYDGEPRMTGGDE